MLGPDPHRFGEFDERGRLKDPNMYRTSYNDACAGREVCVKSDYPSGYGGHVPTLGHQILFKNSPEAREVRLRCMDPSRDSFGGFDANIKGEPYLTPNARRARQGPTAGYFPKGAVRPPWAVYQVRRPIDAVKPKH